MNAVIIVMIPIKGKRNALTAPRSTPTFTMTIENSPLGEANANADLNDFLGFCLKIMFPSIFPPNFMPVATTISASAMKM